MYQMFMDQERKEQAVALLQQRVAVNGDEKAVTKYLGFLDG